MESKQKYEESVYGTDEANEEDPALVAVRHPGNGKVDVDVPYLKARKSASCTRRHWITQRRDSVWKRI